MHAASIVALVVTIAAMIPLTGKESQRMLENTNRLGASGRCILRLGDTHIRF